MDSHHRHLPCLLSSRNQLDPVQDLLALMAAVCSSHDDHLCLGLSLHLESNPL